MSSTVASERTNSTQNKPEPSAPSPRSSSHTPGFARRFLGKPLSVCAAVFLVLVVLACFLAPVVAPFTADASDFAATGQGPSGVHWLGTDKLGRDVLSRLLYGGANTLGPVLLTGIVALLVGVPVGIVTGFRGGRADRITGAVLDGIIAVPSTIFLLAVLAVFPHNLVIAMTVFGVLICPPVAKVVRSATLGVRAEQYIDFARMNGVGDIAIMWRHVRSKVAGPIVVQMTLVIGAAITVQAGLEFLGLGPQPPTPTWGNLVSDAADLIHTSPWMLVPTGGILALTTLALWFVGDGVRDSIMERWQGPAERRQQRLVKGSRVTPHSVNDGQTEATPTTAAEGAILQVTDLSVAFATTESEVRVVDSVSLSLRSGHTVALLGESGCGKSVTARALAGLLPGSARVQTGSEVFAGTTIDLASSTEGIPRTYGLSVIFQEPIAALDPTLTVGRTLTDSLRRHEDLGRAEARRRAVELLAQVDIPEPEETLGKYPHEISGGMAQRVCIARALAARPRVLIADEPTTALDVTVQAGVLDLLREKQRTDDLAVLFVTHDWGVVADIADSCVVMYAGQVVETGSVDDLFTNPRHPYSSALLQANPASAAPGQRLAALEGRVPSPAEWPVGCRFQQRCPFATEACAAAAIPLSHTEDGRSVRCIRWKEIQDEQR